MSDVVSLASPIIALPEIFLAAAALVLLVVGVSRGRELTCGICVSVVGCFGLALLFLLGIDWDRGLAFGGMFVMDQFAGLMKMLVLVGLMASVALSVKYLQQEEMVQFEYPLLVMLAGLGMLLMVSANDMLMAYMALELQALSLYVLAAFRRDNQRSGEAGIKYFILGALSSGMLLFGISLVYGYTGAIGFDAIAAVLAEGPIPVGVTVGMVFILVGMAFKLSAVPFHMWSPDVYEGAATSVTALFVMVPKIAAMALLIRLMMVPFGSMVDQWQQVLWVISVGSMVVGGFGALVQTNIKRLMAYSSISHMGYALVGLVVASPQGISAVIIYLVIYLMMTAGVFSIILMMRRGGLPAVQLADLAGFSRHNPMYAYAMAILMFSMGAIPPMAGFFSKMFVFQAAVQQGMYVLAVIGVLTSVIAAFYYLRIIKVMFFDPPADPFDQDFGLGRRAMVLISVLFVLAFILVPDTLVQIARNASSVFFGG
ncbi:MAG: NADH-quinone oxidoreductase subunit NuoN [Rhodospirillales bacterium]|nr:NADH-quinone oxidoreductase subunit NuoN [Rhodospirillales bacterium]